MFFEVLDRLADFTEEDYNAPETLEISHEDTLECLRRDTVKDSAAQFERIVAKKPIYERWAEQTATIEILRNGEVHRVRFQPGAHEVCVLK